MRKSGGKRAAIRVYALYALSLLLVTGQIAQPTAAADWGYDNYAPATPEPAYQFPTHRPAQPKGKSTFRDRDVHELRAKPQTLDSLVAPDKEKSKSKGPGARDEKQQEDLASVAQPEPVKTWLEILGLVAPLSDPDELAPYPDFSKTLAGEQRDRFSEMVATLLSEQPETGSVTSFWKGLKPKLKNDEQRANYRLLFRALLRLRLNSGVASKNEQTLIQEALGPQRMVVEEDSEVPFSEDAVNSYTDMAMFLYERHNPGKDINTDQNRQLFSKVVRGRYKEAPTDADRAAMNNFPLNWAKFRIVYTEADEAGKEVLEKAITSEDGVNRVTPRNPALDSVLQAPLWATLIAKTQKPSRQPDAGRGQAASQPLQPKPAPHTKPAPPRKGAPPKKHSASR